MVAKAASSAASVRVARRCLRLPVFVPGRRAPLRGCIFLLTVTSSLWQDCAHASRSDLALFLVQVSETKDCQDLQDVEEDEGIQQVLYISIVAVYRRQFLLGWLLRLDVQGETSKCLEDGGASLLELGTASYS